MTGGDVMKKNILIVGGSSGVGLELARHYVSEGHNVCVTGRTEPDLPDARFFPLPITASAPDLAEGIDRLVTSFTDINTLVYAAGFLQRGAIDTLDDDALLTMTNVGLVAPMMLAARLKPLAPTPLKLMLITSSSGYIQTPFWKHTGEDTSTMLEPRWTADQIVDLSGGAFKYKYAKILRNPARVEVVEKLDNDFKSID
jgi:short-subunit dehydrogenase